MRHSGVARCLLGVIFGIFAPSMQMAGAQGLGPTDKFALLLAGSPREASCELVDPMIAGSTSQGGYSFEYQSGRGKNCRIYRLRNKPGRELTPVLWKDKYEVFIDAALARCPTGSTCAWIEAIKPSRQSYQSKTILSYGINKDEYKETPPAYSDPEYQMAAQDRALPYYIIVRGTVADAEGRPVQLGLGLASIVPYGKAALTYQMTATSGARNFDLLKRPSGAFDHLTLRWSGAESQEFVRYLRAKNLGTLPANDKSVMVDIALPSKYVVKTDLMTVLAGGRPIFATTAPAYRPVEEWTMKK